MKLLNTLLFTVLCVLQISCIFVNARSYSKKSVPGSDRFEYMIGKVVPGIKNIKKCEFNVNGKQLECVSRGNDNIIIPLKYNAKCSYGDAKLEEFIIYEKKNRNSNYHRSIRLFNVYDKHDVYNRHYRLNFANGCKFDADFKPEDIKY